MVIQGKKNRILLVVDLDNIEANFPKRLNFPAELAKLLQWLEEIGEVSGAFVFAPLNTAYYRLETFQKQGFFNIICPKLLGPEGEKDTTDETLIKFTKGQIEECPSLTHLCLASGDKDFLPLIEEAKRKGLKIAIAVSTFSSLSFELMGREDKHPTTGEQMLYVILRRSHLSY